MITVQANCYNCPSTKYHPYDTENGFFLVKCDGCGLLYVTPRPSDEELARAHECGVHQGDSEFDITGTFSELIVQSYSRPLSDLYGTELESEESSWLDIGCGHGEFLTALSRASNGNISGKGLEPNRHKQQSARDHGLDVEHFDIPDHQDSYDTISLLNVFSHLPDPPSFIDLCKKVLKPGGEILIQTGDTAELPASEHHRPYYLPDHLSFVSEKILVDILTRGGFQIVSIRKYPAFPFSASVIQWIKEAAKLLIPGKDSRLGGMAKQFRKSKGYDRNMYIRAKLSSQ